MALRTDIVLEDTTLRDGEQTPGVAFAPEQKFELACLLSDAGVHMLDVGHIPLHYQVIPWAMRSNVTVVHRADNRLTVKWVKVQ